MIYFESEGAEQTLGMKLTGIRRPARQRGMALLLVILATLVLAFLARTVTITAARRGFDSMNYVDAAQGTMLAEAGTQFVIDEVSRDLAFSSDINNQALTTMQGSFSVDFVTAGTSGVGSLQSVNNIEGTDVVDGPRGNDTVPPGTMDLVLVVDTGGEVKVYETLVRRPAANANLDAIQSAGEIKLTGTVSIDGIQNPSSEVEIDGGLHSSVDDPLASGIISWTRQAIDDTAVITGKVTTTSASGTAIDMAGAVINGGTQTGVPGQPQEDEGIVGEVLGKAGSTPLSVPPVGVVAPGSGDFYAGGNVSVDGDLVLEDSELYINGDLVVNGSIQGTGTVWVTGETSFRGDAIIRTSTEDSVSLMSHGNVELKGFGGLEYLETLAATSGDPLFVKNVEDTGIALTEIQAEIAADPDPASMAEDAPLDRATQPWRRVLADARYGPGGYEHNTLQYLLDRLTAEPPGPTRDFMVSRVDGLNRVFKESTTVPGPPVPATLDAYNKWLSGDLTTSDGYWDMITEMESVTGTAPDPVVYAQLLNYGRQASFNKLGTSSFRGVVHTNGAFLAENEVTVVGQVRATGLNPTAPDLTASDGSTVEPGEVLLGNGCHITYCQSYVDKTAAETSSSEWEVSVWIER